MAPKTVEIIERDYLTEVEEIQSTFKKRPFRITRPESEFPELIVSIPDSWDSVQLAPLYDVHIGSREFDEKLFLKHRDWIASTPNVLTWNGGDMFENVTDPKMGHTSLSNEEQGLRATELLAPVQHKMMFSLPGNHEDRTSKLSGMSSARTACRQPPSALLPRLLLCAAQVARQQVSPACPPRRRWCPDSWCAA